ncbi:MAG: protein kinase [Candidatus Berkiellales bacterium]
MLHHLLNVSTTDWEMAERYFETFPHSLHMPKGTLGVQRAFSRMSTLVPTIYAEANKFDKTAIGPGILGKGHFGKVKIAQKRNGECFALKIQKPKYAIDGSPHFAVQTNEVKVLQVLGFFEGAMVRPARRNVDLLEAMKHNILMTLFDGDNLYKRVTNPFLPLTETQLLLIALQSARGLKAIHEKNVLHCDIKPANMKVKITGSGGQNITVNICDNGLSIILPPGKTSTFGQPAGTPLYMAPEINRGLFSQEADIYALGKSFKEDLKLPRDVQRFIDTMLDSHLSMRPHIDTVIQCLINALELRAQTLDADGSRILMEAKQQLNPSFVVNPHNPPIDYLRNFAVRPTPSPAPLASQPVLHQFSMLLGLGDGAPTETITEDLMALCSIEQPKSFDPMELDKVNQSEPIMFNFSPYAGKTEMAPQIQFASPFSKAFAF